MKTTVYKFQYTHVENGISIFQEGLFVSREAFYQVLKEWKDSNNTYYESDTNKSINDMYLRVHGEIVERGMEKGDIFFHGKTQAYIIRPDRRIEMTVLEMNKKLKQANDLIFEVESTLHLESVVRRNGYRARISIGDILHTLNNTELDSDIFLPGKRFN